MSKNNIEEKYQTGEIQVDGTTFTVTNDPIHMYSMRNCLSPEDKIRKITYYGEDTRDSKTAQ